MKSLLRIGLGVISLQIAWYVGEHYGLDRAIVTAFVLAALIFGYLHDEE